jgi:hypothetical protein
MQMQCPSLDEARQQMADAVDRVTQIRKRRDELADSGALAAKADAEECEALALAAMGEVDLEQARAKQVGIRSAPMSPGERKRALAGLDQLLAEAMSHQAQAKGTLRRASVKAIESLLADEQAAFDEAAKALNARWARISAIYQILSGITGINRMPLTWHQLRIPVASPQPVHSAWNFEPVHPTPEAMVSGAAANVGRNEAARLIREAGVLMEDI